MIRLLLTLALVLPLTGCADSPRAEAYGQGLKDGIEIGKMNADAAALLRPQFWECPDSDIFLARNGDSVVEVHIRYPDGHLVKFVPEAK